MREIIEQITAGSLMVQPSDSQLWFGYTPELTHLTNHGSNVGISRITLQNYSDGVEYIAFVSMTTTTVILKRAIIFIISSSIMWRKLAYAYMHASCNGTWGCRQILPVWQRPVAWSVCVQWKMIGHHQECIATLDHSRPGLCHDEGSISLGSTLPIKRRQGSKVTGTILYSLVYTIKSFLWFMPDPMQWESCALTL